MGKTLDGLIQNQELDHILESVCAQVGMSYRRAENGVYILE